MKIFKYCVIVPGFLVFYSNLWAQDTSRNNAPSIKGPPAAFVVRDSFKFSVIANNPEHEQNLSVFLYPGYFELYGLNINMGYETMLRYSNNRNFSAWALYRGSYFEFVSKNTVNEENSIGGPATSPATLKNFEIGGEYIFNHLVEKNDESVYIGRFGGYKATRNINADYARDYGLRLGVQYFETYISGDQIPLKGYYENDPSKKTVNFGLGQLGTNLEENIIGLGLSMASTHDLVLNNQTLGTRKNHYRSYLYGDILYAPAMVYTNVVVKGYPIISGLPYTDFNVNATEKMRVGLRMGFIYYDLSPLDVSFGLEGGSRPGPSFVTGLYALAKFGIAINSKVFNF
jgi:hypothetical protein